VGVKVGTGGVGGGRGKGGGSEDDGGGPRDSGGGGEVGEGGRRGGRGLASRTCSRVLGEATAGHSVATGEIGSNGDDGSKGDGGIGSGGGDGTGAQSTAIRTAGVQSGRRQGDGVTFEARCRSAWDTLAGTVASSTTEEAEKDLPGMGERPRAAPPAASRQEGRRHDVTAGSRPHGQRPMRKVSEVTLAASKDAAAVCAGSTSSSSAAPRAKEASSMTNGTG